MATVGGEGVPEVIRELMIVERSAGSTLSQSLKSPGGLSPLVHDASGVREQVVLYATDTIEKSIGSVTRERLILAAVVAGVAGISIGGTLFVTKVVPKIRQSLADKRAQKETIDAAEKGGAEIAKQPAPTAELPRQMGDEIEESGVTLDSAQWFELFFEVLARRGASNAHRAISAEQWMTLVNARVVDDVDTQALASAMRELTPEEVNEKVDLILEQHPELFIEDPATVVEWLFGEEGDESLIPISATSTGDALLDAPQMFAVEENESAPSDDKGTSDDPGRA